MKIGVVGLGYVGLPLAIELSKHFDVVGFDVKKQRIQELRKGIDSNKEHNKKEVWSKGLFYTNSPNEIGSCTFYIVCVPTPITKQNLPDLLGVKSASKTVASVLKKGDIVVFESTVYPGVTEDNCVPILAHYSGLKHLKDFNVGYSPERINPGDKEHTIDKITKVISADTPKALKRVKEVYNTIAPVYEAKSIQTAEAAKVIENVQRDLNIALINEFSCIFRKIGLETYEVLEAAKTKWNFLDFRPGFVGGHCISVDPYYLTYKAESVGYIPQVILAGRRTNENMVQEVLNMLVDKLNYFKKPINGSKILILGASFKENVKDTRNSKVEDLIDAIEKRGGKVLLNDPWFDVVNFNKKHISSVPIGSIKKVDAVIVAVPHKKYKKLTIDWIRSVLKQNIIIDLKNYFKGHKDVMRL